MRPTNTQIAALRRRDPVLGAAIPSLPPFPDIPVKSFRGPHFHVLARSIIYQQLATKAAATIYRRVKELSPGPRFPTPEHMLALSDERLRGAGLSGNKTKAVRDLATRIVNGDLRLRGIGRCDDEEIIRRLTTVWGIGEWTAQMFLIFCLGRLDVFAPLDLGIRTGIEREYGMSGLPETSFCERMAEAWAPYRSVACLYLWRSGDLEL